MGLQSKNTVIVRGGGGMWVRSGIANLFRLRRCPIEKVVRRVLPTDDCLLSAGPHPGEGRHFPLGRHLVDTVGASLPRPAHFGTGSAAGTVASVCGLFIVGPLFVEHLLAAATRCRRFSRAGYPFVNIATVHTLCRPGKGLPRKGKK
jgi:hypothetical protein